MWLAACKPEAGIVMLHLLQQVPRQHLSLGILPPQHGYPRLWRTSWDRQHYTCFGASRDYARQAEIVCCLLENDCSVIDSQDVRGQTPLFLAAKAKLPECCAALLQAGSLSLYIKERKRKGYIAVPACGGSLAEAKHA
eukprot:431732-Pelagomonas_calceolata.AAC.1